MQTKEQDIEKLCREILSLRDQAAELYERSKTIHQQATDTVGRKDDAIVALGALLGAEYDRRAFQTHNPTDGRAIIVVVSQPTSAGALVERVEVLLGIGPQIGIGEIVDPDFEVVEEDGRCLETA